MTERDTELAEQAEAFADRDFKGEINWGEAYESKLIELVRADERDFVMNEPITKAHWQRFENDIRADEREACVEVVEGLFDDSKDAVLECIVDAIRARGNT